MKKINSLFFGIVFANFFLTACTNDSEKDLIEDTGEPVTYTNTIKTVIDNNCIFCHTSPPQNGAPMSLNSYNLVIDAIQNRDLINRISKTQGDPQLMPLGGTRLPQSTIDKFIEWSNNGFPN